MKFVIYVIRYLFNRKAFEEYNDIKIDEKKDKFKKI